MNTLLHSKKTPLCRILTTIMIISTLYLSYNTSSTDAATTIASFIFKQSDGTSTAKDLNDTYGTKADSGYMATSGVYASSSLLYTSVASPASGDYKKLEWSKASEYSYDNTAQPATPLIEASDKNPWGTTPYILIRTSSKGYESLNISFRIGASKKGPRDYKVQYSTNNTSYTDIQGSSFSIASNKILYQHTFNLPVAANNQSTLYIRIITTSTTTVEKGSFSDNSKSGEIAINNITLSGTAAKAKATQTPKATVAPTAVTDSMSAKISDNNSDAASSSNKTSSSSSTSESSATSSLKKISILKLTSYRNNSKKIKGKTIKKARLHITIGDKAYTATASKKGTFTLKIKSKLKKGNVIRIYATKKGYKKSKTKSYTVK